MGLQLFTLPNKNITENKHTPQISYEKEHFSTEKDGHNLKGNTLNCITLA